MCQEKEVRQQSCLLSFCLLFLFLFFQPIEHSFQSFIFHNIWSNKTEFHISVFVCFKTTASISPKNRLHNYFRMNWCVPNNTMNCLYYDANFQNLFRTQRVYLVNAIIWIRCTTTSWEDETAHQIILLAGTKTKNKIYHYFGNYFVVCK